MNRVFITAISLQGGKGLEKGLYKPNGFELEMNKETSFPIIPIINEQKKNIEDVKIIVLRTENNDVKDNYSAFLEEVEVLGVPRECVCPISVEENQSKVIGLNTLMHIINEIPEDSVVYADITFGTKPMSAIILYAMSFIEKLKDVEVDGIYYGELPRDKGNTIWQNAKLYDLTAYKYLADIVEQLKCLEVSNPEAALKKLIEM